MAKVYVAVLVAAVAAFFLVPVAQAAASGTVKVNIAGSGSGKIRELQFYTSSEPEPIDCPTVCEGEMPEEFIALGAFAGENSKFVDWTITKGTIGGFCESSEKEIIRIQEIEDLPPEFAGMDGACFVEPVGGEVEVTATFAEEGPHLTVLKSGEGTVIGGPWIECGSICLAELEPNVTVVLTASPAVGWAFSSWAGCLEHVGLTCKVRMSQAKEIKVTFVATPSLTVEKAGSGYGKVFAPGISCDESCSKSTAGIKTGAAVVVKATPAKGYEFVGFEGGTGNANSCSATCSFTISEKSSVKAKFSPLPSKTLTVKLTGPGAYKGKVTGKVVKSAYSPMIRCGAGCTTATERFFATGETELVATPALGYTFAGWTVGGGSAGTCTGTTTPCKLLTDADKTVEAEFE